MTAPYVQTATAWRRSVRPVPTLPRWAVVAGALLVMWVMFWGIG